MMSNIRYISIAEFRRLGFVQEINRRLLHPCGLALEVSIKDDGEEFISGVWDYRDDQEGITFGSECLSVDKAASVDQLLLAHVEHRTELFGSFIQPLPGEDLS